MLMLRKGEVYKLTISVLFVELCPKEGNKCHIYLTKQNLALSSDLDLESVTFNIALITMGVLKYFRYVFFFYKKVTINT